MIDISGILDDILRNLPGNNKLQESLGLIGQEDEPFNSIQDIAWSNSTIQDVCYELASMIVNQEISEANEEDIRANLLYREITSIINRRMLLKQIISSRYAVAGIPCELFSIYGASADEGWGNRLKEILTELKKLDSTISMEDKKLSKLFGD